MRKGGFKLINYAVNGIALIGVLHVEETSIETENIVKQINEVCELYEGRIKNEVGLEGWAHEGAPAVHGESKTEEDYREFKRQIRNVCYCFKERVLPTKPATSPTNGSDTIQE